MVEQEQSDHKLTMSPAALKTELELGKFEYVVMSEEQINSEPLESRQATLLEDGAVYEGQWSEGGHRQGKGI